MNNDQNFVNLYLELAELISQSVPEIRYIDLWGDQVNFLSEEHPFPSPALFLSFRILNTADQGLKVQKVRFQIDTYIFYETFADTARGAVNQGTAVAFLKLITDTYAVLHGTSGENYSDMRRIGFAPVSTGGSGNLYQQTYEATLIDSSAQKLYLDSTIDDLEVEKGGIPPKEIEDGGFIIP